MEENINQILLDSLPDELIVAILDHLNFDEKMNARLINSKMNGIIDIFRQREGKEWVNKLKIKNPVDLFEGMKNLITQEIYYYLMDNYKNDEEDDIHANYYVEDVNENRIKKEFNEYMDDLYPLFRTDLENHLIRLQNKILLNPKSYKFIKRRRNPSETSIKFLFPTFTPRLDKLIENYFREYDDVYFNDRFLENILSYIHMIIINSLNYDLNLKSEMTTNMS